MRDDGLALAIRVAGGVGALARGLGISQPSVSGWARVPADRVLAIEALTGVTREQLRPDLYAVRRHAEAAGVVTNVEQTRATDDQMVDDIDKARAEHYQLIATLLRKPPTAELLAGLAQLSGDASPLGMARIRLAEAAAAATEQSAGEEFFKLFIGVGRGEIVPYGSFYLTGFLHERPLARVREDLARLGLERRDGIYEPEDHITTLLEAMSAIIMRDTGLELLEAGTDERFFAQHVRRFAPRLFADIAVSQTAKFYRTVAEFAAAFIEIEAEAFQLPN
jgi:TorA maturation chaperone TorD